MSRFTSKFEYLLQYGTKKQIMEEMYRYTTAQTQGYTPSYAEVRLFDKLELKVLQEEFPK